MRFITNIMKKNNRRGITKVFIFLLILSVQLMATAQQTKLLTAEKHNEYGLVYTLPQTALEIQVVAVKEKEVAGPFSKYAKMFTSATDVISKDSEKWSIESVNVVPYGVADDSNRYLMQLKAGSTTFIQVAEDGMLLAINKEVDFPEERDIEVVAIEGNPTTGKEYLEFVNEDFVSAISSYKKAQILAEEIMEIRDAKISLTRGTAETMPTDGKQLELMLQSLAQQEKALTNAFTGNSWKERVVKTFTILPDEEGDFVVCRLDANSGLMGEGSKGQPLLLSVNVTDEAALPVDAKGEEKKIPKDAVIYRIPSTVEISINLGGKNQLFKKEIQMGQFGMLFGLNPSIFTDKKEPSYAIFNPTTGAVEEIGTLK
ncbi:MAG: DUF4831 family protein [Muribaculaceae bacterium]|nr:DUF4831 family protein [Muribaculaceae bacterium]